jgi:integrase
VPVYAKGRGKWRVRIYLHGQRQDWIVDGTRQDAEAFEARKRVELEALGAPRERRVVPTFSSFCVDTYRPHAELRLKPTWWKKQQYLIATLIDYFGTYPVNEINAALVESYARKRLADKLRGSSINNELRTLGRVLSHAREQGLPVALGKFRPLPERDKRETRAFSDAEVTALLNACASECPALLPMVVFLVNTGCRRGEALALTWEHVDLERRLVKIWPSEEWQPKSGKPREVPISDALLPWLKRPQGEGRYVFPARGGKKRWSYWPARLYDLAQAKAKLSGGVHRLRHTFATHFLASVPDLYLLARVLGHSDVAVTRLYSHLLPDHLARARNAVSVAAPSGPAAAEAAAKWSEVNRTPDRTAKKKAKEPKRGKPSDILERETGLEPATFSLGRVVRGGRRP